MPVKEFQKVLQTIPSLLAILPTRISSCGLAGCGIGIAVPCELFWLSAILLALDRLILITIFQSLAQGSHDLLAWPSGWKRAFWSKGTVCRLWLSQTTSPQCRQWWRRKNQVKVAWQTAQSAAEASGFQCAVVGGPVTVPGLESRDSDMDLERRRWSCSWFSSSTSWAKVTVVLGKVLDLPLSKLLSLLAGGVSGACGLLGISVARVSVGRRAAGM
jgi:hypothetical protein